MSAIVGALDQIAALCTSLRELFGRILRAEDFNGAPEYCLYSRCCCRNHWINLVTAKGSFAAARRDTKCGDILGPERQRTGPLIMTDGVSEALGRAVCHARACYNDGPVKR